jgi:hypothetical protein
MKRPCGAAGASLADLTGRRAVEQERSLPPRCSPASLSLLLRSCRGVTRLVSRGAVGSSTPWHASAVKPGIDPPDPETKPAKGQADTPACKPRQSISDFPETAPCPPQPAPNVGPDVEQVHTLLIKLGHPLDASFDRRRGGVQPLRFPSTSMSHIQSFIMGAGPSTPRPWTQPAGRPPT